MRSRLRRCLPFRLRLELLRLIRLPGFLLERGTIARTRIGSEAQAQYPFALASHESPLMRDPELAGTPLQRGKEQNVARAAGLIHGLLIGPHEVFSYHHSVGWPSRRRGFEKGLELKNGEVGEGIGGGCCQVSNMLFWLCLQGGMRVVERHRHGLDLFPDHERTVPFGCGATVFYNCADLRFENPLPHPVLLDLSLRDGYLEGALRAPEDPGWSVCIYELDHRFYRKAGAWHRENRIRRRIKAHGGATIADHEVAHNVARVLYEPVERQKRYA